MLVSIQSQTLIAHPIVNEPGYDGKEQSTQSTEYNHRVRLWTIRHAMTEALTRGVPGFDGVVRAWFATQHDRILRQAWAWAEEAPDELRPKMVAALDGLRAALGRARAVDAGCAAGA